MIKALCRKMTTISDLASPCLEPALSSLEQLQIFVLRDWTKHIAECIWYAFKWVGTLMPSPVSWRGGNGQKHLKEGEGLLT